MKSIKFHPKAELEMIEAAQFYEEKQKLLGKRFLQAAAVDGFPALTLLSYQLLDCYDFLLLTLLNRNIPGSFSLPQF